MAKATQSVINNRCVGKSDDDIRGIIASLNNSPSVKLYKNVLERRLEVKAGTDFVEVDLTQKELKNYPFELVVAEKWANKYKNAIKRDIEFSLTLGDISKLLKRKTCAYTGVKLTNENRTIERINPKLGYIRGNVLAISYTANQIKSLLFETNEQTYRMSFEHMKRMMKSLEKYEFGDEQCR